MKGTNLNPALVNKLRENTALPGGLHHFDLSNALAGPRELSVIGDCIKQNVASIEGGMAPLISIDLTGNQICGLDSFLTGTYDSSGLSDLLTVLSNVGKMSRLRKLNLSKNFLDVKGCSLVASFLITGPGSLTELCLRECGGTPEGMMKLFDGVKASKSISSLDVRNNIIGAEGCAYLAEIMATNSKLKQLLMSECEIGPQGGCDLARALQTNMTLEILNTGDNSMGDEGAEAFATMLKINKTLKHLDLQENGITFNGASALSVALTVNRSLVFLGLQWNDIDNNGAMSLAEGIRLNTGTLRSLHVLGTQIDVDGIMWIIESSKVAHETAGGNVNKPPLEVDLGFAYHNIRGLQQQQKP